MPNDFFHDLHQKRNRAKLEQPTQRRIKLVAEMLRQIKVLLDAGQYEDPGEATELLRLWEHEDRFDPMLLKTIEAAYNEKKVFDNYWKLDT